MMNINSANQVLKTWQIDFQFKNSPTSLKDLKECESLLRTLNGINAKQAGIDVRQTQFEEDELLNLPDFLQLLVATLNKYPKLENFNDVYDGILTVHNAIDYLDFISSCNMPKVKTDDLSRKLSSSYITHTDKYKLILDNPSLFSLFCKLAPTHGIYTLEAVAIYYTYNIEISREYFEWFYDTLLSSSAKTNFSRLLNRPPSIIVRLVEMPTIIFDTVFRARDYFSAKVDSFVASMSTITGIFSKDYSYYNMLGILIFTGNHDTIELVCNSKGNMTLQQVLDSIKLKNLPRNVIRRLPVISKLDYRRYVINMFASKMNLDTEHLNYLETILRLNYNNPEIVYINSNQITTQHWYIMFNYIVAEANKDLQNTKELLKKLAYLCDIGKIDESNIMNSIKLTPFNRDLYVYFALEFLIDCLR